MSKINKFFGPFALVAALVSLCCCGDQESQTSSSQNEAAKAEAQASSPLVIEIRNLLGQKPHDEKQIIEEVGAMAWEEVVAVLDQQVASFQQHSSPPSKDVILRVKMKLRTAHHDAGAGAARTQKQESLEGIKKTLQEMAEDERLAEP